MIVLILKTWRLHKILVKARLGGTSRRQKPMSQLDMFKIIMAFLSISYILLMAWQLTSPMVYKIMVIEHDSYDNPIKSYGFCYLPNSYAATGLFVLIILFVVMVIVGGNIVCFIARNDETVNNEVTFISLSMVNFLQVLPPSPLYIVLLLFQ